MPDAATRAVLATQRLAARSYSPSALQHFAACPYRFLLHAIHRCGRARRRSRWSRWTRSPAARCFTKRSSGCSANCRPRNCCPSGRQSKSRILEIADRVLDRVAARKRGETGARHSARVAQRDRGSAHRFARLDRPRCGRRTTAGCPRISNSASACDADASHDPAQHAAPKPCSITACACAAPST